MRQPKVWISLFIFLVIGLHALPVLSYQGHRQTRWPILAWAMYAKSLPRGPIETTKRRIAGATLSGENGTITTRMAGMSQPALRKMYLQPMWQGDSSAAQQLMRRLNRERPDPYVEVRVEGEKYTLTNNGVVREELPVVAYRADPSETR